MKKRILSFLLLCCLLLTQFSQAYALGDNIKTGTWTDNHSLRFDYIGRTTSVLSINSSGIALSSASVTGYQGITSKVSISSSLQQYKNNSWITLKTYTAESNTYATSLSETYTVNKGYSYRLVSTVKAYSGSLSETRTITSPEKAY